MISNLNSCLPPLRVSYITVRQPFRGDGNVQPIIQIYFEFIGVAQHACPRTDVHEALNSVAAFSLDVLILRRYE